MRLLPLDVPAIRARSILVGLLALAAACGSSPAGRDAGGTDGGALDGGGRGDLGNSPGSGSIACVYDNPGHLCTCVANDPAGANQTSCSAATVGLQPAACCADKDWPRSGTCACSGIWCGQQGADACECLLGDAGNGDTPIAANACNLPFCCAVDGYDVCNCYSGVSACGSGGTHVAGCGLGAICAPDHVAVTSCR